MFFNNKAFDSAQADIVNMRLLMIQNRINF